MGRAANRVTVDGKLFCSNCKNAKELVEFYRDNSTITGYSGMCKVCKLTKYDRDYRINSILKHKYKITKQDFDRMVEEQEGRCAICGVTPAGDSQYNSLYVDHNHETKVVRGLLCRECNTGLGHFADNIERLMSAVAYLIKDR